MSQPQEELDLDAPPALAQALRGAYQHRVNIPARADDVVLVAARQKFARRRHLSLRIRWAAAITAAAATIALVLWLLPPRHPAVPNQIVTKAVKGDIDRSGQLDIVDAMTLAKHLRAKDPPQPAWDVNGDNRIDQQDVDALAAAAVSLKQQGLAQHRLPTIDQLGLARLPSKGDSTARHHVILSAAKDLGTEKVSHSSSEMKEARQ
jgi:Dockerin type I domain